MPPSVWTITLNSAAGSRYRTVVLQTCFTNSSISQQQFLALSRSLKFRSLTWEAVQQMQCAWYLVCTNHRCSILSFTRCVQRVYCAWCGRILKARLPSLALSSRSPNPGVRNKASTPVTVAGIFTTLLSAHIKKRCEQQWLPAVQVRVSITAKHFCLRLLVKLLLSHDFLSHVPWHPKELSVQRQLIHPSD